MRIVPVLLLELLGLCALHASWPAGCLAAQMRSSAAARDALGVNDVAGRVVRATDKHPIPGALVSLREEQGQKMVLSTRTDEEGRFRFHPQAAGKYDLHAAATGYLGSSYLQHETYFSAIVLGAGLNTDDLALELTPSASIIGRILDESGDPVQHASLTLFREDANAAPSSSSPTAQHIVRFRNAQTDDDGSFEFAGVAPGQFYLLASATPWYAVYPRADSAGSYAPYRSAVDPALDVAYPELFYPGARSPEEATPFVVKAGERVTADMTLRADRSLTLSFRLPPLQPGQAPQYRVPQLSRSVFGIEQPVFAQNTSSDEQTVTLSGLTPGHYTLRQFSTSGGLPLNVGSVDIGSEPITMDLPSDAATAGAPVVVKLGIANETAPPSGLQVVLRGATLIGPPRQSLSSKEGIAEFTSVPGGDYRCFVSGGGRGFPVLTLTQDGKVVPGGRLHVSGSDPVKVELTLSAYAPTIEGFAKRDGRVAPGAMVVLVPAGADTSEDLFRRDQSNLDGSFALSGVVPGNYLLVAIEEGWTLRWNDPKALLPYLLHAVPVAVPSSGAPAIHLDEPAVTQPR